jgi:NAD(P)H-dependent FMN reductase
MRQVTHYIATMGSFVSSRNEGSSKTQPHVQIIVGSVREGRMSGPVARWVANRFETEFGRLAEVIDLRDWPLPPFDIAEPPAMGLYPSRLQRAWATTISRADAFVFVIPEYNHGYPSVLKNALDWIFAEWKDKPVAFVSFGNANGSRAIEQMKQVICELRMVAVEPAVALHPHRQVTNGRYLGTADDDAKLSKTLAEMTRLHTALNAIRKPSPISAWSGKRVQVIGLDQNTNRSVVSPIMAAGIDAHGVVIEKNSDLPDSRGFDLIAIGRGAAGPLAEAIKAKVVAVNPVANIVEVVGPLAVRQVIAALDPDAPRLQMSSFRFTDGRLKLTASGDDGRLGVTVFEHTETGLVPHRVVEVDLLANVELNIGVMHQAYSVVVDLDGAAFWHQAINAPTSS